MTLFLLFIFFAYNISLFKWLFVWGKNTKYLLQEFNLGTIYRSLWDRVCIHTNLLLQASLTWKWFPKKKERNAGEICVGRVSVVFTNTTAVIKEIFLCFQMYFNWSFLLFFFVWMMTMLEELPFTKPFFVFFCVSLSIQIMKVTMTQIISVFHPMYIYLLLMVLINFYKIIRVILRLCASILKVAHNRWCTTGRWRS